MPDLAHQLGDLQRRQRRDLRGLQHDGVAGGQRRTHLPAREHEREVPRHDLADHAERLAQHVVQEARSTGPRPRPGTCRPCRRSSEARAAVRGTSRARVSRSGWPVSSDSSRASSSALASIRSAGEQERPAVGAGQARPRRKRAASPRDRAIDVGRAGQRDLGDGRVVVRIERGASRRSSASTKRPPMKSWCRIGAGATAPRTSTGSELDRLRRLALRDRRAPGRRWRFPTPAASSAWALKPWCRMSAGIAATSPAFMITRAAACRSLVGAVPVDLVGQLEEPLDPVVAVDDRQDVLLGGRAEQGCPCTRSRPTGSR
jgi:hypothetical protein